ncbi:MAG: hypothetical protein AAF502_22535, partial [Bacteroidota bacterium]
AVFTEYPRQYVFGAGLVAEAQYRIGKNFKTKLLFDYLGIKAERSGYNYLFYTWELMYNPWQDLSMGIMLTNKHMNLDTYYQTFYMTGPPSINIHFRKPLDVFW